MTMPLQLRCSVDNESVAMGGDLMSHERETSGDAGTTLRAMRHRYAVRDVSGASAC
jgi:hypothetical protein